MPCPPALIRGQSRATSFLIATTLGLLSLAANAQLLPDSSATRTGRIHRGWGVGAEGGVAFASGLDVLGEQVRGAAWLSAVQAGRLGHIAGPIHYWAALECSFAVRNGEVGARAVSARAARVGVELLAGFPVRARSSIFVGVQLRNQREFADFDARVYDNFRTDVRAILHLPAPSGWSDRLGFRLTVGHAIGFANAAYFVIDPRAYARAGVRYTFYRKGKRA